MSTLFSARDLDEVLYSYTLEDMERKRALLSEWREGLRLREGREERELSSWFLKILFVEILGYKERVEGGAEDFWTMRIEDPSFQSRRPAALLGFYARKREVTEAIVSLIDPNLPLHRVGRGTTRERVSPVHEAFNTSSLYEDCQWIILTNMQEIRLYRVHERESYESFSLYGLREDRALKRFYYLLCRENLISQESKGSTLIHSQKAIELRERCMVGFYPLYREALIQLVEGLRESNPLYDTGILLEKGQRILYRLIFLRICEEKGLRPKRLEDALCRAMGEEESRDPRPLMEMLGLVKKDRGQTRPSTLLSYKLFQEDPLLERLVLERDSFSVLYELSIFDAYSSSPSDFLANLFEESIGDKERIETAIEGEGHSTKRSKRKREGIYYTPSPITHYILERTLGTYLERVWDQLGKKGLREIDSTTSTTTTTTLRPGSSSRDDLLLLLREYRERLKEVRILDPACGTGAFLAKAFDYLLQEYRFIQDQILSLQEEPSYVYEEEEGSFRTSLLGEILYGVDLSKEAVETTRFILWLKAQDHGNKTLPSLKETIKSGNSLIHDPNLAGEKAFSFEREFSHVLEDGGFHVVVGNPPYVSFGLRGTGRVSKREDRFIRDTYTTAEYKVSLYALFIELGLSLLGRGGLFGYILPDSFLLGRYYSKLRQYILSESHLHEISLFFQDFWKLITVGKPVILILEKKQEGKGRKEETTPLFKSRYYQDIGAFQREISRDLSYSQDEFWDLPYFRFRLFFQAHEKRLVEKMEEDSILFREAVSIHSGIRSKIGQRLIVAKKKKGPLWQRGLIKGGQIERYLLHERGDYIHVNPSLLFPGGWDPTIIKREKLLIRQTGDSLIVAYDDRGLYHLNNIHTISLKRKEYALNYILALLNSRLFTYYYRLISLEFGRSMAQTDIETLEKLPLKHLSLREQRPFVEKAERIRESKEELKTYPATLPLLLSQERETPLTKLKEIVKERKGSIILYSGRAKKLGSLAVSIEKGGLTISASKGDGTWCELIYLDIKDREMCQYLNLFLENLTLEQVEAMQRWRGNLVERVLNLQLPGLGCRQYVKRVMKRWKSFERKRSDLQRRLEEKDREVDAMVYKLYGLTQEEIERVERGMEEQAPSL